MENYAEEQNRTLELSEKSIDYLAETRKWASFLSILGFIGLGLMILVGLISVISSVASPYGGVGILFSLIYLIMGAIYFIPINYLFKFSNDAKEAFTNRRSYVLESALENLKSHYKFLGIFTIVVLSIYLLFFLGSLLFYAAM